MGDTELVAGCMGTGKTRVVVDIAIVVVVVIACLVHLGLNYAIVDGGVVADCFFSYCDMSFVRWILVGVLPGRVQVIPLLHRRNRGLIALVCAGHCVLHLLGFWSVGGRKLAIVIDFHRGLHHVLVHGELSVTGHRTGVVVGVYLRALQLNLVRYMLGRQGVGLSRVLHRLYRFIAALVYYVDVGEGLDFIDDLFIFLLVFINSFANDVSSDYAEIVFVANVVASLLLRFRSINKNLLLLFLVHGRADVRVLVIGVSLVEVVHAGGNFLKEKALDKHAFYQRN